MLRTPVRRALAALALLAAAFAPARAWAVTVSPTALFIDARSPSGTLTLYNGGTLPEELEISFAFGYPTSDADGTLRVEYADSAAAGEPTIVPWMRAFPRRLTLQPGQRQTLRVLVQPPAGLLPGEYWGRVMVRSRGGQPPIEQVQGEVRMQLAVETVVATAVLFRKGEVTTGIAVPAAAAEAADGGVRFTIDLDRQGNGAYLGRVVAELVGPDGRVVEQVEENVPVYHRLRRRYTFRLPAGGAAAGHTVRWRVDTERPDLPAPGPLKAEPVTGTAPVR